jgi:DNA-binding SARP family transcriptional activator
MAVACDTNSRLRKECEMPGLRLNLLGKPQVFHNDAPVTRFTTAKTEALLYYLAVTGRPHGRDALASLLWGDMSDAQAKRNLTKALSERERLRELMLGKLDELVAQHAARAEYGVAREGARRLLELDPWRESAHRQMMTLLVRQGQYSAALAQYEKCRRTLADELGVEPMAETTALYERIQAMRAFAPRPLPAEAEPFVGRGAELVHIQGMLTDPACRLVSILGLGGVGKTRLALAAAPRSFR